MGLRLRWLGTDALSWRDALVIVRNLPRDSALARATDPEEAAWGLPEHLLARTVEALEWLQWAKTADGEKGRNRPKRIPRPGVTPEETTRQFGFEPVSLEEMNALLGWDIDLGNSQN